MPSDTDRDLSEEVFRKIEATLVRLRAAATAPPDPPEPWLKRTFGRSPPSSRQSDLNVALVDTLAEAVTALREMAATGKIQLDQVQQDLTELRSLSASLREHSATIDTQLTQLRQEEGALRERSAATETLLAQLRQDEGALRECSTATDMLLAQLRQEQVEVRDRLATMGQELAQAGPEQSEKINQLATGQENLANELRERIQHLLDEQRVCLRQVSLKTSEEAVLADRARRATELRLEEIARRLPEHPA